MIDISPFQISLHNISNRAFFTWVNYPLTYDDDDSGMCVEDWSREMPHRKTKKNCSIRENCKLSHASITSSETTTNSDADQQLPPTCQIAHNIAEEITRRKP
jgi:hypothetical protein